MIPAGTTPIHGAALRRAVDALALTPPSITASTPHRIPEQA